MPGQTLGSHPRRTVPQGGQGVLPSVLPGKEHHGVAGVGVGVGQEAEEQEEHLVGVVTVTDGHLLPLPARQERDDLITVLRG